MMKTMFGRSAFACAKVFRAAAAIAIVPAAAFLSSARRVITRPLFVEFSRSIARDQPLDVRKPRVYNSKQIYGTRRGDKQTHVRRNRRRDQGHKPNPHYR